MQQHLDQIEYVSPSRIAPAGNNARIHDAKQIRQIARSMKKFGAIVPLLVDRNYALIAGHGRLAAAKQLRLEKVPVIQISHLSEADQEAFAIADNRLGDLSSFSNERLAASFVKLGELGYDMTVTGFELPQIDMIISDVDESQPPTPEKFDALPDAEEDSVTRLGDLWQLGPHTLICGDAKDPETFDRLMWGQKADVLFRDESYNERLSDIGGKGKAQHEDFVEASGEMTPVEFTRFLQTTLGNAAFCCRDGAIAFTTMNWQHMSELMQAGTCVFGSLKQLCVWAKTNAGMGTFYRSQHELVFVWKVGSAPHTNNFMLGQGGRHRTNLWTYAGVNTFRSDRMDELQMHPTVKPVALIADALRDVSNRGEVVLDCFGGSGSTLIAAEKTGRIARLIEIDPRYCDVTIHHFQKLAGKKARLSAGNRAFDEVAEERKPTLTHEEVWK